MSRHVLLKAAAVLSYFSFYLLASATTLNTGQARFFWLWYGIPSLLILLIPKRWSALAQGMALGQGIIVFREAMLPLALGLSFNGLSTAMLPLIGFTLAQVLLFIAALLLGWPSKTAAYLLFACGAAAALLFVGLSVRRWEGTVSAPLAMNVYRTVGCLDTYRLAHGGAYPAALEELTRTTGQYCVSGPLTGGDWRPQKLFYHPVKGPDGHIAGYSILFGPDDFWGKVHTAWYVDQTGLVHTSPEGQFANKQSPIWSDATLELKDWSDCYTKYASTQPANGTSFDWKPVLRPAGPCRPDLRSMQDGQLPLGPFYTAYFHVKPPGRSGKQWGFYVIARPDRYGESGVRSYYFDETGIIRATPQNREATSADEPTPECEWNEHVNCLGN